MFGEELPSTPDAVRDAVARRHPPGTSYGELVSRLGAEGFPMGQKGREDGRWTYTVAAPKLMASRWGMVQEVRVRFTEGVGPDAVTLGEARRFPNRKCLRRAPPSAACRGCPRGGRGLAPRQRLYGSGEVDRLGRAVHGPARAAGGASRRRSRPVRCWCAGSKAAGSRP